MNAEDLARFLREHPDFFTTHGDIFAEVTVPHPHGGQAITLAERQLHALRDKIRTLESRLAELIRFGQENDAIGGKVHRLSCALLQAAGYAEARHVLIDSLRDDFCVPHVAWRVWDTPNANGGEEFALVSEALRGYAAELRHPYCGPPNQLEVLHWLGEAMPHVRSVALLPLRDPVGLCGMLVLASEEENRFYAEMGTLYLSRIGELVAAMLRRYLG